MAEDTELKSAIGRMIQAAQHEDTSDYTRSDLFERYMGEPYGDEKTGRSQFISTDVSDVVEAVLADVMDVFTSTEHICEFNPVGEEDQEAAKQETDAVNHIFWEMNDGFLILHNWIKEAFIQQNSYVKSGWVEKERVSIEEYEDLTPMELQTILGQLDGEYEFLELEGLDEAGMPLFLGVNPQTGEQVFEPIRCKLRCVKVEKKYVIENVPQEEFFITPRWNSLSLDGVPCCGHRREMKKGDLRAMGFSEETIEAATQEQWSWMDEVRNDTRDHWEDEYGEYDGDDSVRKVMVYEAYVMADQNDDGKPELLKVWAIGDGSTIAQWEDGSDAIEEVGSRPFSALTPCIVPHRHVGRSLAEQVDDIARVKTILMRNTLDSIYATVYPRPYFNEDLAGNHLVNDLLNPKPGAPIRTGNADVQWQVPQDISGITLPLMGAFDSLKEERTGASRLNQGLNSESLNPHSEETVRRVMNAGEKRNMLIARIMAETGIRDLFLRAHRDFRSGPIRDFVMRLRNKWVPVNPRTWRERTDMTVKVGMGSGDRDTKRQGLMMLGNMMEKLSMDPQIRQMGLVGYPQMRELAEDMMSTYGYDDITRFLPPPEAAQPPPEQGPSPEQQAMMAQVQMAQQELSLKQQKQEADIAAKMREIELRHQRELDALRIKQAAEQRQALETQADIQTDAQRLDLDRQKAVMEDDRVRDVEELKAATAFQRDIAKNTQLQPPFDYGRVTSGR